MHLENGCGCGKLPAMNATYLLARFHLDTQTALRAMLAEQERGVDRWYLHGYAPFVFQLVGIVLGLISMQLAGAVALTTVLFNLYTALNLSLRARLYARIQEIPDATDSFRYFASRAWRSRAIRSRLLSTSLANICAGMGFISLYQIGTTGHVSTPVMGWFAIASSFVNAGLWGYFKESTLVGPLLSMLKAPPTPYSEKG